MPDDPCPSYKHDHSTADGEALARGYRTHTSRRNNYIHQQSKAKGLIYQQVQSARIHWSQQSGTSLSPYLLHLGADYFFPLMWSSGLSGGAVSEVSGAARREDWPFSGGEVNCCWPGFSRQVAFRVVGHRCHQLMSWYRGLLSPVVGFGTAFAISFSSYGAASRFLQSRRQVEGIGGAGGGGGLELTLWEKSVAGSCAGIANAPFRTVFERVKSVMQVRVGKERRAPYSWSGACAVDLVRREGVVMGLFRGMETTMLREGVQCAIYYPTYAVAKDFLMPPNRTNVNVYSSIPEPALQMLAGGVAGCVTWAPPVYFFDVIKTRMQTAQPGVYQGSWDCLMKTLRAEGTPALFRGLGASLLRAFPLHGLVFVGYETTIAFLEDLEA